MEKTVNIEKILLAVVVTAWLIFSVLDSGLWHPGFASGDETTVLSRYLDFFESGRMHVYLTGCSLQSGASLLACAVLGHGLGSLHAAMLATLTLETLLLFLVARRHFGERAAAWAVMTSVAASFTLMRGHSLLAFGAVPAELLALWLAFPPAAGLAWNAAWGAACAVLMLDYEIWMAAAPLAVGIGLVTPRGKRERGALLAGFLLACVVELSFFGQALGWTYAMRQNTALPPGGQEIFSVGARHLKEYWLGGAAVPYIGVTGYPSFPPWAWVGLALGLMVSLWKSPWLIAGVVFGFGPLALHSLGLEPQRAILAWPLVCILSGIGFNWLWGRLPPASRGAILLLPMAGFAMESRAVWKHLEIGRAGTYADSLPQREMTADLRALHRAKALQVLTHFDKFHSSASRFLLDLPPAQTGKGPLAAIIPWYYLPALRGMQGRLETYPGPRQPAYVFYPEGAAAVRLVTLDHSIQEALKSLPPTENAPGRILRLKSLLSKPGNDDVWLRSVLWKEYLESRHYAEQLDQQDIESVLAEALPSAEPYRETALYEGRRHPDWGIRLMERSAALDSRLPFSPQEKSALEYFLRQKTAAQKL